MKYAAIIIALLLTACGGGEIVDVFNGQAITAPTPSTPVQVTTPAQTVHQLHAIVRPDTSGNWFIQNDGDHAPVGIVSVSQTGDYIEILFDRTYSHAGTIQVTMDDDFNGFCTAGANLGLSASRIRIKCNGVQINPANIYGYVPTPGSGNLWVNVTMVQR